MNCITFSNWINAWSMRRGLRALGYRLATGDPGYLLDWRPAPPVRGDTLLFTEEASLARYLGSEGFHFLPRHFPPALLDDKFAFGEYACSVGVAPLPQWTGIDDAASAMFPLVLKARCSWMNGVKMPRGWVCRSPAEIALAQKEITRLRLPQDQFFFQQWLPATAEDNFSVCGFWDAAAARRNLVCVVQRRIGYGADLSSSSVVAVVPDPADLLVRCGEILNGIAFQGPFELEFLRHESQFHVLELNPRFWMQHGLFVSAGNGLMKRYLGIDAEEDWGTGVPEQLLWIDGMWLLRMISTFQRRTLQRLFALLRSGRYAPVFYPDIKSAFACLFAMVCAGARGRAATLVRRLTGKRTA